MGKVVGVYLNKRELQGLQELGKELGLEGDSAIVKTALNHLATTKNGHNGHNPSEPTVEIPIQLRLRAIVKESIRELKEENKRKAESDARAKQESGSTDRLVDSLMKVARLD